MTSGRSKPSSYAHIMWCYLDPASARDGPLYSKGYLPDAGCGSQRWVWWLPLLKARQAGHTYYHCKEPFVLTPTWAEFQVEIWSWTFWRRMCRRDVRWWVADGYSHDRSISGGTAGGISFCCRCRCRCGRCCLLVDLVCSYHWNINQPESIINSPMVIVILLMTNNQSECFCYSGVLRGGVVVSSVPLVYCCCFWPSNVSGVLFYPLTNWVSTKTVTTVKW